MEAGGGDSSHPLPSLQDLRLWGVKANVVTTLRDGEPLTTFGSTELPQSSVCTSLIPPVPLFTVPSLEMVPEMHLLAAVTHLF